MDFFQIRERSCKNGVVEIYPDFRVCRSKDLMVRGKSFYAIWDEEKGLWSTDEYDVQRLVDRELNEYAKKVESRYDGRIVVKRMADFSSRSWSQFRQYLSNISDNSHQLDERLTFLNTEVTKKDYISKRLNYNLEEGDYSGWDELIGTLYDEENRRRIEWAIGSVVSGDSRNIQKFIVFYGEAGAGKSTILNVIQELFEGYYTTFDAKALTSSSNAFSTEVFKSNPLVGIQHDGDLSRIEDNTKLNSIVSHEEMTMNEKYKASYTARANCFLFMATNRPVKITDAKSGIIRRLIDVKPSGKKIPPKRYQALMSKIDFELGAIAKHCLDVYQDMGKNYYNGYRPLEMILQTDVFFNFVEANYFIFSEEDSITLMRAYDMYKTYCEEALVDFKLPRHKFREELKNYFREFYDRGWLDGKQVRSVYSGFMKEKFSSIEEKEVEDHQCSLVLEDTKSILDDILADCPAQYATKAGTPMKKWSEVTTTLKDLDTTKLHYVKPPLNHIVIDFDLKDEKGEKSIEKNLEEASKWPATYAEFSQGGSGIHLHYIFTGDPTLLASSFSKDIEIKTFTGNAALRRRVSRCRNIQPVVVSSNLPRKERRMLNFEGVKSERKLRDLIEKNLRKDIHPGTKPSVDFIYKILEDAYSSGLKYDVTDMRPKILAFANNSTHQSDYCVKLVSKMKFKSEEANVPEESNGDLIFFDVEVFPNLFLVNWKVAGEGKSVVRMINPTSKEIENLMKARLVGFNCRRYDNHILYARYIGYSIEELFNLSQKIINESKNCMFGEAYNISYTDVYDFASAANKKSLKKFEIELGIHHQELGLPWDQPVPEEKWPMVAEYCDNDVIATEAVFNHLQGDWAARQILAELSGLTVNDTTNQHSTKIIFGNNKQPQDQFVYTDLSEMFPGYKYDHGVSTYRGEETGEGGYVYAEPGIYTDVALLDVASMHPTSIECLNLFGPYTRIFSDIKSARIAIKHKDYKALDTLMDGRLKPFVEAAEKDGKFSLKDLSNALKTVINSIYGLTSAKFENPFRDPRNIDNIVAKRGALFMIDLKHAVQEKGFTVAHIKTDSIKIPNATEEIIAFVMEFGESYGYTFEHEATYEKMCLVNDAVYVAKLKDGPWTATGAQFQHPVVFKTLFSKEPLEFKDFCETKSVKTALYLDFNEDLGEDEHSYQFIGKAGLFVPVLSGYGGGILLREKDGKYYAATGTKGYRWMEAEVVRDLEKEDIVDRSYGYQLIKEAINTIDKFGDCKDFIQSDDPPWDDPCKDGCENCDKKACPII